MPRRQRESDKKLPAFDLRAEREKRGINQQDTADILCTTQGTISAWESSGNTPLIYRKYWELYWTMHLAKKTRKVKQVSDGPATH
jgi:DNA-binding XRE family transcriptional regulator